MASQQLYSEIIRQANTQILLIQGRLVQLEGEEPTPITRHEISLILGHLRTLNQVIGKDENPKEEE